MQLNNNPFANVQLTNSIVDSPSVATGIPQEIQDQQRAAGLHLPPDTDVSVVTDVPYVEVIEPVSTTYEQLSDTTAPVLVVADEVTGEVVDLRQQPDAPLIQGELGRVDGITIVDGAPFIIDLKTPAVVDFKTPDGSPSVMDSISIPPGSINVRLRYKDANGEEHVVPVVLDDQGVFNIPDDAVGAARVEYDSPNGIYEQHVHDEHCGHSHNHVGAAQHQRRTRTPHRGITKAITDKDAVRAKKKMAAASKRKNRAKK